MTPLPATPPSTPPTASAQATTAPSADTEAAAGFAAVLQAQMDLPAKGVPGTEIFAALASSGQTSDTDDSSLPGQGLPVPDLAALLPTVAGLVPQAAAASTLATDQPQDGTAALLPSLDAKPPAPATGAPALPVLSPPGGEAYLANADVSTPTKQAAIPAAPAPAALEDADTSHPAQPAMIAAAPAPAEASATTASIEMQMAPATTEVAGTAAATPAAAALNPSASASDGAAAIRIDTPVGSRGWDAEVGQKVVLMVNRSESRAELTLTPPNMGRVEVTISVEGDRSSPTFVAASPVAREAPEEALPRLREMLADAGIALGQASVNAESPRREADSPPGQAQGERRHAAAAASPAAAPWLRRSEGLIDTFA